MGMKRVRVFEWLRWFLFLVVILWGFNSVEAQTIGKTIDKSNYKEYESLLIPAMLRAVERGDMTLPTKNLDFPYKHSNQFLAAGEKNAGKFDVDEPGDLIDKSTGKPPKYNIYGYPFPKLDPKDPRIAVKMMWNFNFERYRFLGQKSWTHLLWISQGKKEEDRYIAGYETNLYLQGRPSGQEIRNPQNFLALEFQNVTEPMSVRGMNTMSWDYFDERDISQFNYIPAIRRVRQTSGVSRSDPYFGSDSWMDNNYMWSGKNRSFKWKLVGERTVLAPFTHTQKEISEEASDGTMTLKRTIPKWGFRVKDWKGASWAPTDVTYVPRSVWIIEGLPKDPYYNWGLHKFYVDKETYVIWLKEVYEKSGEFRTWIQYMLHYSEGPSGNNTVGVYDTTWFVDEKIHHATLVQKPWHSEHCKIFMPASKVGIEFYAMSNFLQLSK